jgi:hypothetical protein
MSCRRWGDFEAAVFECLGRSSFFDLAVDLVMERIAVRIEEQGNANSQNPSCAFSLPASGGAEFAPQGIREMAQVEALKRRLEIGRQFVETGILALPLDR